ncbi:SMP-30/gluconolactonase/LRE family protein [Nocardioides hungaricus]
MTHLELVAEGLEFPEGPVVLADGAVVVVEVAAGRLTRVAQDGSRSVLAATGGGPNGAAALSDGRLVVCNNGGLSWSKHEGILAPGRQPVDYSGGRIEMVSPDGTVETLYSACNDHPLRGPNDLVLDGHGGIWFTDLGKERARDADLGGVYYARTGGDGIREVLHPMLQPNGIALSPSGDRLYVAETTPGRIWWWPVLAPGIIDTAGPGPAGGRLLHGFGGFQLPDSMAVDSAGNVCVGTLITGAVSVIAPDGELLDQITMPEFDPLVTNICFGGADLCTAYITASGTGRLYRMRWPRPGAALAHQR